MSRQSEPSTKDCRVLIVEDEYFLGADLAEALRSHGAEVIGPVTELSEAMSVRPDGFDVAVVDLNLRGHSASPIVDELMRIGKPFVLTTGYGANTIPDRFRGVRRREKPYELKNVVADVAELCGRRPL